MRWWSQRPGWGERFKTLVPRLCNWTEIRCSPSPRRDEPSSVLHVRSLPKAPKLPPDAATSSEQHWAALSSIELCSNVLQCVATSNCQWPVWSPMRRTHLMSMAWVLGSCELHQEVHFLWLFASLFDLFEPSFKTVRVYCAFPEFRILAFGEEYVESELPNQCAARSACLDVWALSIYPTLASYPSVCSGPPCMVDDSFDEGLSPSARFCPKKWSIFLLTWSCSVRALVHTSFWVSFNIFHCHKCFIRGISRDGGWNYQRYPFCDWTCFAS